MNLQDLVKKAGGMQPRTHEERLMVLGQVGAEAMPHFMDSLRTEDPAGWMNTLLNIGALDLGHALQRSPRDTHKSVVQTWSYLATTFVEMVGKGKVRKLLQEDETSPESVPPRVAFTQDPALLEVFRNATHRLCEQAPIVRQLQSLTPLHAKFNRDDALVGTLSLWMSMACAIDQPEALKPLLDAFPEAMTTGTRAESRCLASTLRFLDVNKAFATTSAEQRFVSPLLVAMHAGSKACIDAILGKRQELGETLNAPLFSVADGSQNHRHLCASETLPHLAKSVAPHMVVYACMPHLNSNPKMLDAFANEQAFLVEKNPDLFVAFARAGVLARGDDTAVGNCLERAIWHVPTVVPVLLEGMDWNKVLDRFNSNGSPIFRSVDQIHKLTDEKKRQREDAVLALIEKAKVDGHADVVLQIYQSTNYLPRPVAQLSEAGFERVLVAYLDHGFDPKEQLVRGEASLLEIAERDHHPTLGAILAHTARRRVHDLLSDLEAEPTAKVSP